MKRSLLLCAGLMFVFGCSEEDEPKAQAEDTTLEWLLKTQHFSYQHGTYGKPTYCGAFEVGAIPGFPAVRCTDNTAYLFSDNGDGTYRLEEATYIYDITKSDPDGSMPWMVPDGYSGSLIWQLTPIEGFLTDVEDTLAIEFDARVVDGKGNDPWWAQLGASKIRQRMVFARGIADDCLIDYKTADWDSDAKVWDEYTKDFQDYAINVYPYGGGEPDPGVVGAFVSLACPTDLRREGASVGADGEDLKTGPGYCPPECRMRTKNAKNGANGLPVCGPEFQVEVPRAETLR